MLMRHSIVYQVHWDGLNSENQTVDVRMDFQSHIFCIEQYIKQQEHTMAKLPSYVKLVHKFTHTYILHTRFPKYAFFFLYVVAAIIVYIFVIRDSYRSLLYSRSRYLFSHFNKLIIIIDPKIDCEQIQLIDSYHNTHCFSLYSSIYIIILLVRRNTDHLIRRE